MPKKYSFEERILSLIFLVGRNLRGGSQETKRFGVCGKENLSIVQLETLRFIGEEKRPLMKDVSDYLAIAPPSLTPLIDNLARRKLIRKLDAKKDRRVVVLGLTKAGKKVLEDTIKIKIKKLGFIFNRLTEEEKKRLVSILKKIADQK